MDKKFIICLTEYDDEDNPQDWFFEKHEDCAGWSDDMNYCATKFSYSDALKEFTKIKKTCGYGWPKFFNCELQILPEY